MGCDEYDAGSATGALQVSVHANSTNAAAGFPVVFSGGVLGHATASIWDFGDGPGTESNRWLTVHAFAATGSYDVILRAFNDTHPEGVAASVRIHVVDPVRHYVRLGNPAPVSPYTNWAAAATNIQDAIDAATHPGAHVIVSNGIYDTGSRIVQGSLPNRIAIHKPVTVRSVNGPEVTVIKGAGPAGDSAIRCVYVGADAVLSGFLLTNGATRATAEILEQSGGGAWCEVSGVLTNCTLAGNAASSLGGGASRAICMTAGWRTTRLRPAAGGAATARWSAVRFRSTPPGGVVKRGAFMASCAIAR